MKSQYVLILAAAGVALDSPFNLPAFSNPPFSIPGVPALFTTHTSLSSAANATASLTRTSPSITVPGVPTSFQTTKSSSEPFLKASSATSALSVGHKMPSFHFGSTGSTTSSHLPSSSLSSLTITAHSVSPTLPSFVLASTAPVTERAVVVAAVTSSTSSQSKSSTSTSSTCAAQSTPGASTENGIMNKTCCTSLTLIFARGTDEIGNAGTITGPSMFKALRKMLPGKVTVQGVDYPADAAGDVNLGATGGHKMAALVKQAHSQCPNSTIVVSGYRQGAMVVHNAFSAQGLTAKNVTAAVLFGDPMNGKAVGDLPANQTKEFCASGDELCERTGLLITPAHLTYGDDVEAGAEWIVKAAGL